MITTTKENKTLLHPYIAAKINHNELNESKAMNIVHTILGNPYTCRSKDDQPEEMGSDTVVLIGLKELKVSKFFFVLYGLSSNC